MVIICIGCDAFALLISSDPMLLTGDNSSFTGGFNLASFYGFGAIYFGKGANFTGTHNGGLLIDKALGNGTTGSIGVPAGVAFGFNSSAEWTTNNIQMFSLDAGGNSILSIANAPMNIDLSAATGLNANVRLGNGGGNGTPNLTFSGIITPFGTAFNFTPGHAGNLTMTAAGALADGVGPVVRTLDVAGGVNMANAVGAQFGTLVLQNSETYSGATTIEGTVLNSQGTIWNSGTAGTGPLGVNSGDGGVTGPTLTLNNNSAISSGNLQNTSSISVTRGSSLIVAGTPANPGQISSANVPITIMGASTLIDGDTTTPANNNAVSNGIVATATLTLGGSDGGGTLTMAFPAAGAHAQTLASLTVGVGSNAINTANTAAGTLNLTLGGYTRNTGGVVNVSPASAFYNPQFSSTPSGAGNVAAGADGDTILIGAYLNNADFAKATSGANLTAPAYDTQTNLSNWGTISNTGNILINAAATGSVATGSINSLKILTTAPTITLGASQTLTLTSGMILNTVATPTITGGAGLTSATNELIVDDMAGLTINSPIVQNGGSNVTFTKVGAGTTTLGAASNAIGNVYDLGGTIQVNTAAAALGSGTNLYLYGGSLLSNLASATYAQNITVGAQGGSLLVGNANGNVENYNGTVALNGHLTVGNTSGSQVQTNLTGNIFGPGDILARARSDNRTILVLSGANGSWSGGFSFQDSAGLLPQSVVRLDSTTAAGTGPIIGSPAGVLEFSTNTAGATFSNNMVGVNTFVNWATTGSVTLSGNLTAALIATGGSPVLPLGLTVQGNAAAGAASETVLAGTVSYAGVPTSYNWSSTPTATIQRFVNTQGGINTGATNFIGTTALNGASNTALLELAGSANPQNTVSANYGELGFLRFNGLNSFLPGAVGPGYVTALHQANDPTNYGNGLTTAATNGTTGGANGLFGIGLTGSATGATYALPQGKSFVIGSLGAAGAGQVGGALYSTGTGTNTAILVGNSTKVTGFPAGDVNIHANAASDTQTLTLSAKNATDTFQIGTNSSLGSGDTTTIPVVFSPTYGDSGFAGSVTLMAKRTGGATLNIGGAGTVRIQNASFTHIDAADARPTFSWNVNGGTLNYAQNDASSASFGGTTLTSGTLNVTGQMNTSATLNGGTLRTGATGTISGAVTAGLAAAAHSIAPGGIGSIGTLGVGSLTPNNMTTFNFDIASTSSLDLINDAGALGFSGTGAATIQVPIGLTFGTYKLIGYGSLGSGVSPANFALAITGGGSVPTSYNLTLTSASAGELDLIVAGNVPSPAITISAGAATRFLAGTTTSGVISGSVSNNGGVDYNFSSIANKSGATGTLSSIAPQSGTAHAAHADNIAYTATIDGTSAAAGTSYSFGTTVSDNSANTANSSTVSLMAVSSRTVVAPVASTSLGRILTGSTVNVASHGATYTYGTGGGNGANANTESATLSYSGSADANNINLSSINQTISSATAATGTFTGTIVGAGSTSGSFSVGVSHELSGAQSNINFAYTADPVARRVITNGASTDLGLYHVGATIGSTTSNPFTTTGINDTTTSVSVAAGSGSADANGISLSGAATTFNGATTSASDIRTFGGSMASVAGNLSGSFVLGVTTLEIGLGDGPYTSVSVPYTVAVTNGQATWTSASDGSWGTGASANWIDTSGVHAAPGVYAGFTTTDTATFNGSGAGANISLNGASPSLKSMTFSGAVSYNIKPGSGGTLRLNNGAIAATVGVGATQQEISAPVTVTGGLTKSGAGTLVLSGASNSYTGDIHVDGGTLRLAAPMASTTSVTAVTVTVASGATLDLAGSVSNLSTGSSVSSRATIVDNNSPTDVNVGVLASGHNQQVGGIDGTGATQVADGADLTADHINEAALIIGSGSIFTLNPSDPVTGSPTASAITAQGSGLSSPSFASPPNANSSTGGLLLARSLQTTSSLAPSGSSLLSASSLGGATSSASLGGGSGGPSVSAVPEPSSIVMLALGAVGLIGVARRRRQPPVA